MPSRSSTDTTSKDAARTSRVAVGGEHGVDVPQVRGLWSPFGGMIATMSDPTPLPRGIGAPATRALALEGIATLDDVRGVDLDELLRLHGVGPRPIRILCEALAATD